MKGAHVFMKKVVSRLGCPVRGMIERLADFIRGSFCSRRCGKRHPDPMGTDDLCRIGNVGLYEKSAADLQSRIFLKKL